MIDCFSDENGAATGRPFECNVHFWCDKTFKIGVGANCVRPYAFTQRNNRAGRVIHFVFP